MTHGVSFVVESRRLEKNIDRSSPHSAYIKRSFDSPDKKGHPRRDRKFVEIKKRKEKLLHLSGRKFKSTVSGRDEFIRDIEDADFYAA